MLPASRLAERKDRAADGSNVQGPLQVRTDKGQQAIEVLIDNLDRVDDDKHDRRDQERRSTRQPEQRAQQPPQMSRRSRLCRRVVVVVVHTRS
jgi:hypothetical protein